MTLTPKQKEDIIKFCKKFIDKHGSIRIGWAIQQIVGEELIPPTHLKEKIANTIIQSGEYLKEKAEKKYPDWNIYKNPLHNKVSRIDKINLGLGIFSIIGVAISIWISIWGVNTSESIAEKSGAFDKGELHLSFGGYLIYPNINFDVYYGVDFSDSILHFATLPIGIHNKGKKTLENVSMLLRYPHIANIAIDDSIIKFEGVFTEPIERKFFVVEPYDEVSYKFNSVNPNFSIHAGDLICLQKETIMKEIIPVTTKDNQTLNVSTLVNYSYPVQIGLTAKDAITEQYNLFLNYRNETNLDTLIRKIIMEKINSKNQKKEIQSFFVIIPKENKTIGDKKHRMKFLNSDATTTLFCEFDKTLAFVAIINQDGTIQQQIKLAEYE